MPLKILVPDGLPSAVADKDDAAWAELVDSQLANVRKIAENWRNGLVAMQGLLATALIVKGPSEIDRLDRSAAYGVAILLLLGLVASIVGTWTSLAAAYGSPKKITRAAMVQQGGIAGLKYSLATGALRNLATARFATLTTIAFFVAALALTWFGPTTPEATLRIEGTRGGSACGKLAQSSAGYLTLHAANDTEQRFPLRDIVAVKAVATCR